jgi:shikimate kinase
MKIILIGFMGSGKTTIAKILAKKLGLERIDMDELIIKNSGRTSDREIFEKDGELAFRELEIAVAKELEEKDNAVISTGGGVVMNTINLLYLKKNGKVIFLKNDFETSKKRVDKNNPPPLFQNETKAQELYQLRLPLYTYNADIIITTDDKTKEEVTEEIIKNL